MVKWINDKIWSTIGWSRSCSSGLGQYKGKGSRLSCSSIGARSSKKRDGKSWVNECLLLSSSQSIPGSFVLGSSIQVLKWPVPVGGMKERTHVRPRMWTVSRMNSGSLETWDLQVTWDCIPYWGIFFFFFHSFLFLFFFSTHISMRETEASKAGQASINMTGRQVIFKILGTMEVIKVFDLF